MASGRGSNFEAIYKAIKAGKLNAEVTVVISNKPEAKVITSAAEKKLPTAAVRPKDFDCRADYEEKISAIIDQSGAEIIVLAGYMLILGEEFIGKYENRIVNIHPALLPSFPGLDVQQKAIDYGVKFSGCTIHFVDEGTDTGPIIMQRVVPVLDNDTDASLSKRILKEEHDSYWKAIQLIADKKIKVDGRRVINI